MMEKIELTREQIIMIREIRKLSQRGFATELGFTLDKLKQIENGTLTPSEEDKRKILDAAPKE